jgi:copper resistance protein B
MFRVVNVALKPGSAGMTGRDVKRLLHVGAALLLVIGAARPALAQEAASPPAGAEEMPQSVDEVRDPEGPITAEDLAIGNIEVPGEPVHDDYIRYFARVDRLEYQSNEGDAKYVWDVFGYAGGDYNKLWLKSEGEGLFEERLDAAELQVLYSRAILPYWDVQAGVRHDFRPNPSRTYAVLGLEGLNLFWFEVETALFLSDEGDLSARLEAEFDQLLTQRLILQPRVELNLQAQEVSELGLGAGLTDYEAGLRLRYEFVREFAPYVGVSWTQRVGETADMLPSDDDAGKLSFVAGVRMWF